MRVIIIILLLSAAVYADASIVLVPDADTISGSWTATPLWSKVDESTSSPDTLDIISPAGSTTPVNFSLNETVEGETLDVIISVASNVTSIIVPSSLNVSWYTATGSLVASFDTGTLTTSMTQYNSASITVAINRTQVNTSYILLTPSPGLPIDQITVSALNLNVSTRNTTIIANGSLNGFVSNLTGENLTIEGSCEATGLSSAENVYVLLQNSTDNVTFTTITTDTSETVYANVSYYSIGTLTNSNSSAFRFHVNATKSGLYSFRIQCNGTNTEPREYNSSSANFTAGYVFGGMIATLMEPVPDMNTNVAQNRTFSLVGNVTCTHATNPTAVCGGLNGTARFNYTAELPETQINITQGDIPFWTEDNKTCGFVNYSNSCILTWSVNATGQIGRQYALDVLFTSNESLPQTDTEDANLTIIPCAVDFSLWSEGGGTFIDFGTLAPSTLGNPAPRNDDGFYNITINPTSCVTDLFIRGTNLTNSSFSTYIGVGNVTWNNETNDYDSSFNLSGDDTLVMENVPEHTNVTTWYWINVPPVFAGIYNGTITISGVESV